MWLCVVESASVAACKSIDESYYRHLSITGNLMRARKGYAVGFRLRKNNKWWARNALILQKYELNGLAANIATPINSSQIFEWSFVRDIWESYPWHVHASITCKKTFSRATVWVSFSRIELAGEVRVSAAIVVRLRNTSNNMFYGTYEHWNFF